MEVVLVTGTAGFIGFHTAKVLLESGYAVIGIDNFCDYYDVRLKEDRHRILEQYPHYTGHRIDICDASRMEAIFEENSVDYIIHLAAQAGVRYSLEKPTLYIQTNALGFGILIDLARRYAVKHFIYASSSSVYGANTRIPFKETDCVEEPLSVYGATKKANELIAYSYSHLFQLPTTGLRFFTVYGPFGRPDMAFFKFTKALFEGTPIDLYNNGDMRRDFTYIDDIVTGILGVLKSIPDKEPPYVIYNIGNTICVPLEQCIDILERATGKKANIRYLPMQDGDMYATYSDITALHNAVGYTPTTSVEEGIPRFVDWYKEYYKIA
ncbi:MAG: NAD-dependent epimerase/dehydratase family protein [Desulfovibrionaceae bacterium]|nr:NAD-dependent epimerase/dehydratase family protein [Desulfovibrionaceae bacterium]